MKRLSNLLTLSLLFSLAMPCLGMEKESAKDKQEGNEWVRDNSLEQPRERENQEQMQTLLLLNLNKQFENYVNENGFFIDVNQGNIDFELVSHLINVLDSIDEQECIECLSLVTPALISKWLLPTAIKLEHKRVIILLLNYIKKLSDENAYDDLIEFADLSYYFSASGEIELLVEYAVQENQSSMIEFLTKYVLENDFEEIDLSFVIIWAHYTHKDDLFNKLLQTKNRKESLAKLIQDHPTFFCSSIYGENCPFKNFFPTNDSWISFLLRACDYLDEAGKVKMLYSICAGGSFDEIKQLMENKQLCQCLKNNIDELFPLMVNDTQKMRLVWEIKKPNNFDRTVCNIVRNGSTKALQFLVDQGVDLDVQSTREVGCCRAKRIIAECPLLIAMQNNNEEMVLFLLDNGVTHGIDQVFLHSIRLEKTNIINCICSKPELYTQLKMSIPLEGENGKRFILQLIIKIFERMVVDVAVDEEGVLNLFKNMGSLDFIKAQDVSTQYNWSCYPFILNNMHVCKFLIHELGINSNSRGIAFPTEGMDKEAFQEGKNKVICTLQDEGVPQEVIKECSEKIDGVFNKIVTLSSALNSATLLMIAACNGNAELVKFLLDHGADRELKNQNGLTALDIAKEYGNEEIVKLLDAGEDNSQGYQPWSQLQYKAAKAAIKRLAACKSKAEVQEYLKDISPHFSNKILFLCSSALKKQLEDLPEAATKNETNEDGHTNL